MESNELLIASPAERRLGQRVLITTAASCDLEAMCQVLNDDGIETTVCPDPETLCGEIDKGGGAVILAEEILAPDAQRLLAETLHRQPEWSDFPLIVMGSASQPDKQLLNKVKGCTNAVLLQRPVREFTLLSTVHVALQSRLRQYQVRDELTRRQRSEALLRGSEARFRQLADAMPQLVWTADEEGYVDYFNRRIEDFATIDRDSEGIWCWRKLLEPGDLEGTTAAWRAARHSGKPYQFEHRLRMADGACRWHLSRSVPVKDDSGRVVRWFGTATDIHDLKLAEQALHQASRRKDEFLATLAHELRNPLAPIGHAVEVLRLQGQSDPIGQAARDTIERQLQNLVRLVDDLLDVSRITRGNLELRCERVTLAAVLEQALETTGPHVEKGGLEITIALPRQSVLLNADPVRLAQVFVNLLNNACKYTPERGHISVIAEQDGDHVVVSISDTGIGIRPECLSDVFDMFFQGHVSTGQSPDGLGIGLALAKGLVEMHNGSIEADSEGPGKGSVFRVCLPVFSWIPAAQQSPAQQRVSAGAATARRVLIADDNPDIVDSLAMVLTLSGHEVETARDGLETVATAERYRPEVVLMDIGMPGLDGYDACRRIRAQPWGQDILIVALTGWGQEDDRRRSREAGFNAHLVKPVDLPTLQGLLADQPPTTAP